eukprot:scaffold9.g3157.t1
MSLGRSVPWSSWEEWRAVGQWLLSVQPDDVQRGLERVAAWRVRGRVPLGVDITACLVAARAADAAAARGGAAAAAAAEPALRLQLSMALVRMVNGISDSAQRGRTAASVAALAAGAGLPRLLVDLRHEATHNELPSLRALRAAAGQALGWLAPQYWGRQAAHLDGCLGRVAELDYVALHLAAAVKAASQGGGDGGSEDEEDAPGPAASRGAAARGAEPTASQGAPYRKEEGKRRRRLVLAELRSQVPRAAAALLVAPLLAGGAGGGGDAGATGGLSGGEAAGAAAPAKQQQDAAAAKERGLVLALGHFAREWPQLPGLLLRGALQSIAAALAETAPVPTPEAAAAGPGGGALPDQAGSNGADGASARVAALMVWVHRLLPSVGEVAAQAGSACRSNPAGDADWRPTQAQLCELLAAALPAYAAAAQRACLDALTSSSSAVSAPQPASGAAEALRAVAQRLVALLQAACGSGSRVLVSQCEALLQTCDTLASWQPGNGSNSGEQEAQAGLAAAAAQLAAAQQQQATLVAGVVELAAAREAVAEAWEDSAAAAPWPAADRVSAMLAPAPEPAGEPATLAGLPASPAMATKFTRTEVEGHISNLRALLADIGPSISKSLTALVLRNPKTTRGDALRYVAAQLLKEAGAEDGPTGDEQEESIKAYAGKTVADAEDARLSSPAAEPTSPLAPAAEASAAAVDVLPATAPAASKEELAGADSETADKEELIASESIEQAPASPVVAAAEEAGMEERAPAHKENTAPEQFEQEADLVLEAEPLPEGAPAEVAELQTAEEPVQEEAAPEEEAPPPAEEGAAPAEEEAPVAPRASLLPAEAPFVSESAPAAELDTLPAVEEEEAATSAREAHEAHEEEEEEPEAEVEVPALGAWAAGEEPVVEGPTAEEDAAPHADAPAWEGLQLGSEEGQRGMPAEGSPPVAAAAELEDLVPVLPAAAEGSQEAGEQLPPAAADEEATAAEDVPPSAVQEGAPPALAFDALLEEIGATQADAVAELDSTPAEEETA